MLADSPIPVLGFIFGGVPEGIFFILYLVGSIWATSRAINYTRGPAMPIWLAFIWLVPCLGAFLALLAIKRETPPPSGQPPVE